MILRWFSSKTVREVSAVHKHYRRLLAAQRDLLAPAAVAAVQLKLDELKNAIASGENRGALRIKAEELQFAGEKNLKPYPHAVWRENVEVLLVALAVAMAIRTFFLQPFKIPTGSMQPTLFGVTSENLMEDKKFTIPTGFERIKQWIQGISYIHVVAQADGRIEQIGSMHHFLIFNLWQDVQIGGVKHTIWFPPDMGESLQDQMGNSVDPLVYRGHLEAGRNYLKGDDVLKMRMHAGDHLFVDRLTYNFRQPERGEIIVFETAGIPEEMRERYRIPNDQFYIKRLVGLPGEKVSIGNDRHLRINGKRLDASTPHFGNIYGFNPDQSPHESKWSGHLNATVAQTYNLQNVATLQMFPDEETIYDVPKDSCLPMGDNTCNSLDSRFWGAIPERYVMGRSFFIYWPITQRFGIGSNQ